MGDDIQLNIKRTSAHTGSCIYPFCPNGGSPKLISKSNRIKVMKNFNIYLPNGVKACYTHSNVDVWKDAPLRDGKYDFTTKQIEDMVELLRNPDIKGTTIPRSNGNMKATTGLNAEQFRILLESLTSLKTKYPNEKKASSALHVYLMKLRTGKTNSDIAQHFNITEKTLVKKIREVRECLTNDFVPNHLYNRSRQNLVEHTTTIAKQLYAGGNDIAALVFDGTYIYIDKSKNYQFQKATFNIDKWRCLVKIMMCVTTDGTIAAVYGPFKANQNDASILSQILGSNDNVLSPMEHGDVVVLDRGFRDVMTELINRGFIVHMPKFLPKNQKQLTVKEANDSRICTKTRFIVETRNGHMKSIWKYFGLVKPTKVIPNLVVDFKIGAALLNAFYPTILTDIDLHDELGNLMIERLNKPNILNAIVQRIPESQYHRLNMENINNFPRLTYEDLKRISFGSYQIHNAPSYYETVLRANDNQFVVNVCDEETCRNKFGVLYAQGKKPTLISINVPSRFTSRKFNRCFVLFDENSNGVDAVLEYACSCLNGLRTVGCCSHVMLAIWYICYADRRNIKIPAQFLDSVFDRNPYYDSEENED